MHNENFNLLLVFFAGASAFVLGNYKRSQRSRLIASGIKVIGTVLRVEPSFSSNPTSYHPVISYTTLQNETITGRYSVGEKVDTYKAGDRINIIYDAVNNHEFIIDDNSTKNVGPTFMIVGLLIIVFVIVQYFLHPFGVAN